MFADFPSCGYCHWCGPLALNLEDVDRMIDEATKAEVILMPGLVLRYTPNYVKAKELISLDQIGRPVRVFYQELLPLERLTTQWPPGNWAWDNKRSGGPVLTVSIFSLDLVRWLMDREITQVY